MDVKVMYMRAGWDKDRVQSTNDWCLSTQSPSPPPPLLLLLLLLLLLCIINGFILTLLK